MNAALWARARDLARAIETDLFGWELPPIDVAMSGSPILWDAPGDWCLRCGESVGAGERTGRGCASCRDRPTALACVIRLGEYRPPLSLRVLDVKQRRWHAMAAEFGRRLGEQVAATLPPHQSPTAVAAVPMPRLRRWWRGIDHSEEIGVAAAVRLGVPFLRPLIQRSGPTQVSRSKTDRERATGRFFARPAARRALTVCRRLLLVDDVRTTGATLHQAARSLKAVAPHIQVIAGVVAVVPSPARMRWGSTRDKIDPRERQEQEST